MINYKILNDPLSRSRNNYINYDNDLQRNVDYAKSKAYYFSMLNINSLVWSNDWRANSNADSFKT